MIITDPKWRKYIYQILVALGALALIYGIASKEEVVGWLGLGASILGNGLASANVEVAESKQAE
jgi:membrane-bound ClpP family serine protease